MPITKSRTLKRRTPPVGVRNDIPYCAGLVISILNRSCRIATKTSRTWLLGRNHRSLVRFRLFGFSLWPLGHLDLGFGLEVVQMLHQVLLLNLLGEPRLDSFKRRRLDGSGVLLQYDVVAKLGHHRFVGELAFFQRFDGSAKFGRHASRIKPPQIAALRFGSGITGFFLGEFGK